MKTLGLREMRAGYSALEAALREDGEVLLTHHGKPFARVLPIDADITPQTMPSNAALRAKIKPMSTLGADAIRTDRDTRG